MSNKRSKNILNKRKYIIVNKGRSRVLLEAPDTYCLWSVQYSNIRVERILPEYYQSFISAYFSSLFYEGKVLKVDSTNAEDLEWEVLEQGYRWLRFIKGDLGYLHKVYNKPQRGSHKSSYIYYKDGTRWVSLHRDCHAPLTEFEVIY